MGRRGTLNAGLQFLEESKRFFFEKKNQKAFIL